MFTSQPIVKPISKSISLIALFSLRNVAHYQRQMMLDFLTYFLSARQTGKVGFENRYQHFRALTHAFSQLDANGSTALIEKGITQFGTGKVTAQYSALLAKLLREIERVGLDFFAQYAKAFNGLPELTLPLCLPTEEYVIRNVLSKQTLHANHLRFCNRMVDNCFIKIDQYLAETTAGIAKQIERQDAYMPEDNGFTIAYVLKFASASVIGTVSAFLHNVLLSLKKIKLMERLRCNLLELRVEAPWQDDISGFMRGIYVLLLDAEKENRELVAHSSVGSAGSVGGLLTEQKQWIAYYYPDDALLAEQLYNHMHHQVDDAYEVVEETMRKSIRAHYPA